MVFQKSDYKIHIVGAGVSGLVAATVLEKNGYSPVIIESTDRVGGRVKTDFHDTIPFDHGFQVLLTAYPMAQKYLDMNDLELSYFDPGAVIWRDGKINTIGDPLRNFLFAIPTLVSKIGTIADKIKILKLQQRLRKKTIEQIFESPEMTTMEYLKDFGFSDKMIAPFFVPFFSGIFLETNLTTSSRMFEFVYKMFGEGLAAIPKKGIEAIPNQLKSKLHQTEFRFNTKVVNVTDGCISLEDGKKIQSDLTIIATDANSLVSNLRYQDFQWKGCDTLYFEVKKPVSKFKVIQLIADEKSLINNVFSLNDVYQYKTDTHVLSVTLVKAHKLSKDTLVKRVSEELREYLGMTEVKFLKQYSIQKALPDVNNVQISISPEETRLTSRIFLAGDALLNGSLNGAMQAGELAALGVVHLLEESQDLAQFTSEYI
ncbi:MAG: NAD(P)/FAD-dependent oxidoreductase [Bacteroidota bacterium]